MHHAGQLDVHGPFQRPIHFGRNIIALGGLAHHLQFLYGLHLGQAGGGIDVGAGERHMEALAANEFAVGHFLGWVSLERNDAIADGELIGRYAKALRRQFQHHAAGFGRHPPGRPAVGLDGIGAARAALVHRHVSTAHDEACFVVGDVQLIGHHLPEGRAGALATVRLAHVEGGGVVLMNDDPGVELAEVGVRIRARRRCYRSLRVQAHHQQARALQKRPSRAQRVFYLFRNPHATCPFPATRLMAA